MDQNKLPDAIWLIESQIEKVPTHPYRWDEIAVALENENFTDEDVPVQYLLATPERLAALSSSEVNKEEDREDNSFMSPYLRSEMDLQLPRMKLLGIPVDDCMFEQSVNAVITMAEKQQSKHVLELEDLRQDNERLRGALREADEYLGQTIYEKGQPVLLNSIGANSILHRKIKEALTPSGQH